MEDVVAGADGRAGQDWWRFRSSACQVAAQLNKRLRRLSAITIRLKITVAIVGREIVGELDQDQIGEELCQSVGSSTTWPFGTEEETRVCECSSGGKALLGSSSICSATSIRKSSVTTHRDPASVR